MDRREFLEMAALGSAAAMAAASCSSIPQSQPTLEFEPQFSGEILRLAVIKDATVLASQDQTLPAPMGRALKGLPGLTNILGMGILFPAGATVIAFLAKARRSWFDFAPGDDRRVAIATGYLLHRAVESRLREAMLAAGIRATESEAAKLQQDAAVIRSLLDNPPQTQAEAEVLLSILDRQLRIQIHTLRPDGADEGAWVMRLLAWDAAQEALFKRLAAAIVEPDAAGYSRYVEALNLLPRDRSRANAAQNSAGPTSNETESASLYELALEDCKQVIAIVSQFLEGAIGAKALVQNLG